MGTSQASEPAGIPHVFRSRQRVHRLKQERTRTPFEEQGQGEEEEYRCSGSKSQLRL